MRFLLALLLTILMNCFAHAENTTPPEQSTESSTTPEVLNPPEQDVLRFEDFPAKVFQKKATKNIRLWPQDHWVKDLKADILEDMKEGADFAGHYSMIMVGCGTACVGVRMVDMRNGEVFKFPESGQYQLDLDYSVKSRLMKTMWVDGTVCVSQSYEWTGRSFKKLSERRTELGDQSELCGFNPQPPADVTPTWVPVNGWRP